MDSLLKMEKPGLLIMVKRKKWKEVMVNAITGKVMAGIILIKLGVN